MSDNNKKKKSEIIQFKQQKEQDRNIVEIKLFNGFSPHYDTTLFNVVVRCDQHNITLLLAYNLTGLLNFLFKT